MAYDPTPTWRARPYGATAPSAIDAGLRAWMLSIYNYMAAALAVTGVVAYGAVATGFYQQIAGTPLLWIVMLAPLGFVLVLSFGIQRMSTGTAQLVFWGFAAAMGLSLAGIFLVYTGTSIARTFFITAATFAAMSIYGYTAKADLSRFGSFLMMGLFGIIIAGLVNIFLASSALQFAISIIGVIVFTGLTAYDTQRIKATYIQYAYAEGPEGAAKRSVYDALSLYLNFINLFMLLLQLLGNRNNS
jgi:FtsH-binding integral membrane protein